jgi:hypothetical protein
MITNNKLNGLGKCIFEDPTAANGYLEKSSGRYKSKRYGLPTQTEVCTWPFIFTKVNGKNFYAKLSQIILGKKGYQGSLEIPEGTGKIVLTEIECPHLTEGSERDGRQVIEYQHWAVEQPEEGSDENPQIVWKTFKNEFRSADNKVSIKAFVPADFKIHSC